MAKAEVVVTIIGKATAHVGLPLNVGVASEVVERCGVLVPAQQRVVSGDTIEALASEVVAAKIDATMFAKKPAKAPVTETELGVLAELAKLAAAIGEATPEGCGVAIETFANGELRGALVQLVVGDRVMRGHVDRDGRAHMLEATWV